MVLNLNKINKDLVLPPKIMFTDRAKLELQLIIENDFTLAGKYFRIIVSGKGCDGFTYSAGFTDLQLDDFQIPILNSEEEIIIILDPFAAFYLQEASVDFVFDSEQDAHGFVIVNHAQSEFKDKFWKNNHTKIPPLKTEGPNA